MNLWQLCLDALKDIGVVIRYFAQVFARPNHTEPVADLPMNQEPVPPVVVPPVVTPKYLWDTTANSRHSVRVICDEMGLTLFEKNVITACIQQESNFNNKAVGRNMKDGKLLSSDWGIVQVNDYWNIGTGKKWSSVKQVLDNPDKAVAWMVTCYKQGNLKLWASYSSGAYKKFL